MSEDKSYRPGIPDSMRHEIKDIVFNTLHSANEQNYIRGMFIKIHSLRLDLDRALRRITMLEKQIDGKVDKLRPS